jgi:5'-nucleotidase
MPHWPDFIISGMNQGENLCEDVFFSGTVAGAFTGKMYGVPSMAVSLIPDKKTGAYDFQNGAFITAQVLEKLLPLKNTDIVYNLNIPAPNSGKVMVTTIGEKRYKPSIVERTDPRGGDYFWIGTGNPMSNGREGTDLKAVENGDISLSVLKYDLNDVEEMKKLSGVFENES